MPFFTRLSNGWNIAMSSFDVLKKNKKLIVLPILSGISMVLILGSFLLILIGAAGDGLDRFLEMSRPAQVLLLFLFYLINYFIVVFFNMALIHCSRMYFEGQEVNIQDGISFSVSRIGAIFGWAVVAATVGTILKLIQENLGNIGKIIIGLIGIVWSVLTFFVVPVIAYENVGPIDAIKRSGEIVRQKWGEGIGAGFSFGLVNLLGLVIVLAIGGVGWLINPIIGIALGGLALMLLTAIMSASKMIFISAIYHNVTGDINTHIDQHLVDSLFVEKKR